MCAVPPYKVFDIMLKFFDLIQGNVDKVVVVIKNKEEIPMERFIFAVQNMIEVEPYNKDTRFGGSP